MKRTSSGSAFPTNNDLHIMLRRLSNRELAVYTATLSETGDTTISLRDVLPGSSTAPEYKKLLPLNVSTDMSLKSYRIIVIEGLGSERKGKDMTTMKQKDVKNSFCVGNISSSYTKWFGTLDDYYQLVKNDSKSDPNRYRMFDFSALHSLTITLGIGEEVGMNARLLTIDRGETESKVVVLKLKSCTFVPGGRPLYRTETESEILDKIKQDITYKVFKYTYSDSWLVGMNPSKRTPIEYSDEERNCVYLIVRGVCPFHHLVDPTKE